MNLSRRGLLGMLAAGAGAAIVRPGIIMPIKPSIMTPQQALAELIPLFDGFSQQIAATIFYGDGREHPVEFVGFEQFYTKTEVPGMGPPTGLALASAPQSMRLFE